jgi:hypothetical protein
MQLMESALQAMTVSVEVITLAAPTPSTSHIADDRHDCNVLNTCDASQSSSSVDWKRKKRVSDTICTAQSFAECRLLRLLEQQAINTHGVLANRCFGNTHRQPLSKISTSRSVNIMDQADTEVLKQIVVTRPS